jgi:hypothetical protein
MNSINTPREDETEPIRRRTVHIVPQTEQGKNQDRLREHLLGATVSGTIETARNFIKDWTNREK